MIEKGGMVLKKYSRVLQRCRQNIYAVFDPNLSFFDVLSGKLLKYSLKICL